MKFLHVYCDNRQATVYINLDKIVLLTKLEDDQVSTIELEGDSQPIKVAMPAEDLVRKINGEDKASVGFRTGR